MSDPHRARQAAAWAGKKAWDGLYQEAMAYAMPNRRAANGAAGAARGVQLFDLTAVASTSRGAGRMHQDFFPPNSALFKLQPGPIVKLAAADAKARGEDARDIGAVARQLENLTNQVVPFFQTGEWDSATAELCLDLYLGTGVMLILEGANDDVPVRFVTIPIDECALEPGPYGDHAGLFWRSKLTRPAILAAFPKGAFSDDFRKQATDNPAGEVTINHDFVQHKKGWRMLVTLEGDQEPVVTQQIYKTRPFIAPRFQRAPGETYGRGPVLNALPTIKTVNKVMELTLKGGAINLLGIWGFRPGGSFNPSSAAIAPGQFWPMQSLGGVLGPDVTRLDAAGARPDFSSFLLGEMRQQIQLALLDDQLPTDGATPKSAAEIVARMSRLKQNWAGAFGRLVNEVVPHAVPRVIEILHKKSLITTTLKIDRLLVGLEVISPLALAMKADTYQSTAQAMEFTGTVEGPQAIARRFKMDDLMPDMLRDLGVAAAYVRTAPELGDYDAAEAKAAQAQQLAQAALAKPKEVAGLMGVGENGQAMEQAA